MVMEDRSAVVVACRRGIIKIHTGLISGLIEPRDRSYIYIYNRENLDDAASAVNDFSRHDTSTWYEASIYLEGSTWKYKLRGIGSISPNRMFNLKRRRPLIHISRSMAGQSCHKSSRCCIVRCNYRQIFSSSDVAKGKVKRGCSHQRKIKKVFRHKKKSHMPRARSQKRAKSQSYKSVGVKKPHLGVKKPHYIGCQKAAFGCQKATLSEINYQR